MSPLLRIAATTSLTGLAFLAGLGYGGAGLHYLEAESGAVPTFSTPETREMAATLRDMLVDQAMPRQMAESLFVTPEALAQAFQPESHWGRSVLAAYVDLWRTNMDTLVEGLRRHDLLERALGPEGLTLPLTPAQLEATPELQQLSDLLYQVDGDNFEREYPEGELALVLFLDRRFNGDIRLANIRIVDRRGQLVPLVGKRQQ